MKTSNDMFREIHQTMAAWIEGILEDGLDGIESFNEAITLATKMRDIEQHTDIVGDL